jgi:glutaredoxin-like protein NrdH
MITVYTKNLCPYCDGAKAYLDKLGETYYAVNISENEDAREFLLDSGFKSVPQIFYRGQLLVEGGHAGLIKLMPADLTAAKNRINESVDR